MKVERILTTIPVGVWQLCDKLEKRINKKKGKLNADALGNIERLYKLKKTGAISEEEFIELKERLKIRI